MENHNINVLVRKAAFGSFIMLFSGLSSLLFHSPKAVPVKEKSRSNINMGLKKQIKKLKTLILNSKQ